MDPFFQYFDSAQDHRLESDFVRAVCSLVSSKNNKISRKAIKILGFEKIIKNNNQIILIAKIIKKLVLAVKAGASLKMSLQ